MCRGMAVEIAAYHVCRASTAQSISGAESEVQPELERADVGPDAKWSGHSCETAGWADERIRRSAETVIVVFNEAGEPIQKGIFAAYPNRPAAAVLGHGGRGDPGNEEVIAAFFPGAASPDVAKKTVPGIADPPRHRGNRLQLRRIGKGHGGKRRG